MAYFTERSEVCFTKCISRSLFHRRRISY